MGSLAQRIAGKLQRWQEARMDGRYGIDTRGIHDDLASLGAAGANVGAAYGYEPVQARVFRAILAAAAIAPPQFTFVDAGSGKGRALILAAEAGFRRVIGVELAPALHAIALRNAASFALHRPQAPRLELHCCDAAGFRMPDGDLALFLFNPFGASVLERVLANLGLALQRQARRVLVAYRNPLHAQVLDAQPFLMQTARNSSFALYREKAFSGSTNRAG